jgi:hypothetical protein
MPVLIVDHEQLVREYLAHNKAPRLMVLYLSATTRAKPPYVSPPAWYEGETMLLRYGGLSKAIDFFRTHTQEITRFLTLAGRRILLLDWTGRRYRTLAIELDRSNGYIPPPARDAIDVTNCPMSSSPVIPDREFVQKIRGDLATRGIPVAVYLAPIPDCDKAFADISSRYTGVVDNVPYTLAHRLFLEDHQRQHLLSTGAQQNSQIVGAFLNRFLSVQSAAGYAP